LDLSDDDIRRAELRMQARLAVAPRAVAAHYDRDGGRVVVALASGLELAFPPHLAEGLAGAAGDDLAEIEITPAGLGLHWPRLDADLYLPALMEGVFGSPRWMAGLLGRKGGRARSPAKAAAARRNGGKGGRPRKALPGA
jgi:hypothetical protein